jgi:hypothetical protein
VLFFDSTFSTAPGKIVEAGGWGFAAEQRRRSAGIELAENRSIFSRLVNEKFRSALQQSTGGSGKAAIKPTTTFVVL